MIEAEAVKRANTYLLEIRGIQAKPVEVRLVQRPGSPDYWWVSYGTSVLFPKETAAGATIDGGDLILCVSDNSGEVCEVG
jgi:hypothetical protein